MNYAEREAREACRKLKLPEDGPARQFIQIAIRDACESQRKACAAALKEAQEQRLSRPARWGVFVEAVLAARIPEE